MTILRNIDKILICPGEYDLWYDLREHDSFSAPPPDGLVLWKVAHRGNEEGCGPGTGAALSGQCPVTIPSVASELTRSLEEKAKSL
ncbi:unnamed protein product [Bubo scandiacus]